MVKTIDIKVFEQRQYLLALDVPIFVKLEIIRILNLNISQKVKLGVYEVIIEYYKSLCIKSGILLPRKLRY